MSSERVRSLELGSCPELYRRQSKRCAREGDRQARMHQHAAQGEHVGLSGLVAPSIDRLGEADLARPLAAVDELCRVLQDEDRALARLAARRGRGEMPSEYAMLGHGGGVEKSIPRFPRRQT